MNFLVVSLTSSHSLFFFHPMTNQEKYQKGIIEKIWNFFIFVMAVQVCFVFTFVWDFYLSTGPHPLSTSLQFETKKLKKDTWKRRKPWMKPSSYIKSTDCVRVWGDKLYRGWPPNRRHQKKRTFWKQVEHIIEIKKWNFFLKKCHTNSEQKIL